MAKSARLPVRNDLADELWEVFMGRVQEMIDTGGLTMGTVTGRDGQGGRGNVRVHVDGESKPRKVGSPRMKGTRIGNGDRVWLAKNKAGQFGVIATSAAGDGPNAERGVGSEHLIQGAVDKDALGRGVVTLDHLDNNIAIPKGRLDGQLQREIEGKVDKSLVKGNPTNNNPIILKDDLPDLSKYALDSAVNAKYDKSAGTNLERRVKELEEKIKKLDSKKDKKGTSKGA